jgi:isovaleryl-CoA dehydrogenase
MLSLVAHAGLVRGLVEFGTPGQRERFLPRLLDGAVGATAITEPSGGSDVAGLRTSAVRTPGGYLLSGAKTHITNAPVADVALVLGRIPELGRRDITIFVVDLAGPGVARGPAESLFGNRTSPTGELRFDGLELPGDAVLGTEGHGLQMLYDVISFDRLLYGLIAAAYLEPLLREALEFACSRQAFKVRIADHQYVQGKLTDIRLAIETSRWVSRAALDAVVAGDPQASLRCSVAKLVGSEGLAAATRDVMTILGHRGYVEGPVTRSIQDALGTLIAGGTTEMQRKNIFNQMLGELAEEEVH